MRIVNQNITRGRNKTQKAYEQSMWEKHAFTSLGVICSISEKEVVVKLLPSISYDDYDMKKGFTKVEEPNKKVTCLRVQNLDLAIDDIVVVIFTDMDSRQLIQDIRRGRKKSENFTVESGFFHDINFGIVINKIII